MTINRTIIFTLLTMVMVQYANSSYGGGTHNSNKKFTPPSKMSAADWSDPREMERVWKASLVRIPKPSGGMIKTEMSRLDRLVIPKGTKLPTVIYLHGCSGVWSGTQERIEFLAKNGFAVIAPVSFAREKYPRSCDEINKRGGFYRPTLRMRQFDAGFAIRMAKELDWVDSENVFLMGLSEGGIITATFKSETPETRVNARVVESWTCHAGWDEYRGISAPASEPVLTLVGEKDPWFQDQWTKGDCGNFLDKTNGSQSIVYKSGYLRSRHELLESKEVKKPVLEFLSKHIR